MKQLASAVALHLGFAVKRRVDDARVRHLLARLHPVSTAVPLIRIGGANDGGYLVPDDLEGVTACFSPGVDQIASFEQDLQRRDIRCFLADASVDGPPPGSGDMDFEKKFVGAWNDDRHITMDRWMRSKLRPEDGDLILQMDIEGAEWQALLNISDEMLQAFRILVIEFHSLPHCFDEVAWALFDGCLGRLAQFFHVVHAHPNNVTANFDYGDLEIPHFLEVSFLRKDRAQANGFVTRFPHPLDQPCCPDRRDPPLPSCLHASADAPRERDAR